MAISFSPTEKRLIIEYSGDTYAGQEPTPTQFQYIAQNQTLNPGLREKVQRYIAENPHLFASSTPLGAQPLGSPIGASLPPLNQRLYYLEGGEILAHSTFHDDLFPQLDLFVIKVRGIPMMVMVHEGNPRKFEYYFLDPARVEIIVSSMTLLSGVIKPDPLAKFYLDYKKTDEVNFHDLMEKASVYEDYPLVLGRERDLEKAMGKAQIFFREKNLGRLRQDLHCPEAELGLKKTWDIKQGTPVTFLDQVPQTPAPLPPLDPSLTYDSFSSSKILYQTERATYYLVGSLVVYKPKYNNFAAIYNKEDSEKLTRILSGEEDVTTILGYFANGVIYIEEYGEVIKPALLLFCDLDSDESHAEYGTIDTLNPVEFQKFFRISSDESLYSLKEVRLKIERNKLTLRFPRTPEASDVFKLNEKEHKAATYPRTIEDFLAYGPNSPDEALAADEISIPRGVFFVGSKKFIYLSVNKTHVVFTLNQGGKLGFSTFPRDKELVRAIELSQVKHDRRASIYMPADPYNLDPYPDLKLASERLREDGLDATDLYVWFNQSGKANMGMVLDMEKIPFRGGNFEQPSISRSAEEYRKFLNRFYSMGPDHSCLFSFEHGGKKLRAVYLGSRTQKKDFAIAYETPTGSIEVAFISSDSVLSKKIYSALSNPALVLSYEEWDHDEERSPPLDLEAVAGGMIRDRFSYSLEQGVIQKKPLDDLRVKITYHLGQEVNGSSEYEVGGPYVSRDQDSFLILHAKVEEIENQIIGELIPDLQKIDVSQFIKDQYTCLDPELNLWFALDKSIEEVQNEIREGRVPVLNIKMRMGDRNGPTTSIPVTVKVDGSETYYYLADNQYDLAIVRWARRYLNGPKVVFKVSPSFREGYDYALSIGVVGFKLESDPFYNQFINAWENLSKNPPVIGPTRHGEQQAFVQVYFKKEEISQIENILKDIQRLSTLNRQTLRENFKKNPVAFSLDTSLPTPSIEDAVKETAQEFKNQVASWNPEFQLPLTRNTPPEKTQRAAPIYGLVVSAKIKNTTESNYRDWRRSIQGEKTGFMEIAWGEGGTPLLFTVKRLKSGSSEEFILIPAPSVSPHVNDQLKLIQVEGGNTILRFEKRGEIFQWLQEQQTLSYELTHTIDQTGGVVDINLNGTHTSLSYQVGQEAKAIGEIKNQFIQALNELKNIREKLKHPFKVPGLEIKKEKEVTPSLVPNPTPPPAPTPAPKPPLASPVALVAEVTQTPSSMVEHTTRLSLRLNENWLISDETNQVIVTITTLKEDEMTLIYLSGVRVNGVNLKGIETQGHFSNFPIELSYPFTFTWQGIADKGVKGTESFTATLEDEHTLTKVKYQFEASQYVTSFPLVAPAKPLAAAGSAQRSSLPIFSQHQGSAEGNWDFIKPGMVFSPTQETLRLIRNHLGTQGGISTLSFENDDGLVMEVPVFYNPLGSRFSNPFYLDGERAIGFYLKGQRNETWQAVPKSFRAHENRGNWVFYAIERGSGNRAKAFQLELARPPAIGGRVCPTLFGLVATHSESVEPLGERNRLRSEGKKKILLKINDSLSILEKKKLAPLTLQRHPPSRENPVLQEITLRGTTTDPKINLILKGLAIGDGHIFLKQNLSLEMSADVVKRTLSLSYQIKEPGVLLLRNGQGSSEERIFLLNFQDLSQIRLEEINKDDAVTPDYFWNRTSSFGELVDIGETTPIGGMSPEFEHAQSVRFSSDIPFLPPDERSIVLPVPPPGGFFQDIPINFTDDARKFLEGQSFMPLEETLWTQILSEQDEEFLVFATRQGGAILQIQMNQKKGEGAVRYQATDPSHPLAPLKVKLLIPLDEEATQYYELDATAVANRESGNENIELRVDVDGVTMIITLTQVVKNNTFNKRGVMAYACSVKEENGSHEDTNSRTRRNTDRKLGALVQFFAADQQPSVDIPADREELDLGVEKEGDAFRLDGIEINDQGEASVDSSPFYRASNGSPLFYLGNSNTGVYQTMMVSTAGHLLFWPRRPHPEDIYNPPTAAAHTMRRIDGDEYNDKPASATTRLRLNPLGTERKRFVITQPLGREEGSTPDEATAGIGDLPLFRFEVWEDEKGQLHVKPGTISDLEKGYGDDFPFGENFDIEIQEDVFFGSDNAEKKGKVRVVARLLDTTNRKGSPVSPYLVMVFENRRALLGAPALFKVEMSHFHEVKFPHYGKKKSMPSEPGFLYDRAGLKLNPYRFSTEDIFKGVLQNTFEGDNPEDLIMFLLDAEDNGSEETLEVLLGVLEAMGKFTDGKYADEDLATLAYHVFVNFKLDRQNVLEEFRKFKSENFFTPRKTRRRRGHVNRLPVRDRRPGPLSLFGSSSDYLPARTKRRVPAQPLMPEVVPPQTIQPDNSEAYDLVEDAIEILERMSVSGNDAAVRRKLVEKLEHYLRDEESLVELVDDFYADHPNSGAKDFIAFLSQHEGLVFQGPMENYFFTFPHGAGNVPVFQAPVRVPTR